MNTGLSPHNSAIVSAFHSALVHQGLVVVLLLALVTLAWNLLRSAEYRRSQAVHGLVPPAAPISPEPAARRLLRVSFGLIWVFDGILQGQALMPLGMVPQVVEPTTAASPGWVQHVVNVGATVWSYHPVSAAAAAVWVQVGIGLWLLVAPRGDWSRLGGGVSVVWGLVVWVFGESFGGIFAPGLTWMFGAPGAVLFYCVAGALVALPEGYWATARLGKALLRGMGLFFAGMALLQAWPGRGFWQGQPRPLSAAGTTTAMVKQMAQTPQPGFLSSVVSAFARFDAAHGWAVNLFVVIAVAAIGALLLLATPRAARVAVVAAVGLCLADWVLVQDLGFLGGIGTDPNSMVPMALVIVAGYVAMVRVPPVPGRTVVPIRGPAAGAPWRERLLANPTYTFRAVSALAAMGVVLLGTVPMAVAATEPRADALLSRAVDGAPQALDITAPGFTLVDQSGHSVSLAGLRGKVIALTFLDDTCTTDCPVIAQEFRTADRYLGAAARHVVMVAINANPRYIAPEYLAAFDRQEGLQGFTNWLYLTGSLPQLRRVWAKYGEEVSYLPGGAMVQHGEYAYVIDAHGTSRYILDTDPGPVTEATTSSFAVMLAGAIKNTLARS